MEDEGIAIPRDHLMALAGLLGLFKVVMRQFSGSELGAGGWGLLLSEGNPRGVWLLMEQVTHLEGWLRALAHGGFAEGCTPAIPALPQAVAESFARWRRGIYEA